MKWFLQIFVCAVLFIFLPGTRGVAEDPAGDGGSEAGREKTYQTYRLTPYTFKNRINTGKSDEPAGEYLAIKPLWEDKTASDGKNPLPARTDSAGTSPREEKPEEPAEEGPFIDVTNVDVHRDKEVLKSAQKEYRADISVGVKVPSFGDILFGRGVKVGGDASQPTDDGWRIRFRTFFD